jgi:nucleoside-diphosphate-sugar epimerase
MRILITGINSALADAVARELTHHEVIGLGRKPHSRLPTVLCDLARGLPPLPDVDVCLHMAALTDPGYCAGHPDEAHRVNVSATAALLDRVPRLVFVSTGSVYGFHEGVRQEGDGVRPEDEYARTKAIAEGEVLHRQNATVLRYFYPYGPATKPTSLVNRLATAIRAGTTIELHEGGQPRLNPMYITDLAAATRHFCLHELPGVYNVAGAEAVAIERLAELIGKALGGQPRFRPSGRVVNDLLGSTDKLGAFFRPTVPLAEGVHRTVAYLLGRRASAA